MIGSEKRFEKASDALLSMQTEIAPVRNPVCGRFNANL